MFVRVLEVALRTSQLKNIPSQPVCPIDQVQVANIRESASIRSPLTTGNRDKTIVWTLRLFDNLVGLTENGRDLWLERCTEAVIAYIFDIRRSWVELVPHVFFCKLSEGSSFYAKEFKGLVDGRKVSSPDGVEHIVCER